MVPLPYQRSGAHRTVKDLIEDEDLPEVETRNLCELYDCGSCPGLTTAGRAAIYDLEPEVFVACTHECHKVQ
jgi:hypothetical protein